MEKRKREGWKWDCRSETDERLDKRSQGGLPKKTVRKNMEKAKLTKKGRETKDEEEK